MRTNRSAMSARNSATHKQTSFLNSTMMTGNKKYLSASISTLGLMTLCLGLLVATVQPALASYRWVSGQNGSVPLGAVVGGADASDPLYVCRAANRSGKLHSRYKKCYTSYGGKENEHASYDVLVSNDVRWVGLSSPLPRNAIVGGLDNNNVPLYVCRAYLRVGQRVQPIPGKYNDVNKTCYTPYGGKEYENRSVELLVDKLVASPSISGEVVVEYPEKDRRCQDLAVSLRSIERYPNRTDGILVFPGDSIFQYSQPLSGDIKTGKCNYSITAFTIDAGKQATLTVGGGGDLAFMRPLRTVTIPSSQPVKVNLNVAFSRIN